MQCLLWLQRQDSWRLWWRHAVAVVAVAGIACARCDAAAGERCGLVDIAVVIVVAVAVVAENTRACCHYCVVRLEQRQPYARMLCGRLAIEALRNWPSSE